MPKAQVTVSSNGEISCSIEETNRIRIALGLKPLEVEDEAAKEAQRQKQEQEREAAEQARRTQEIELKIAKAKLKRKTESKIIGKSLGEELEEEDDGVLAWIGRSRAMEAEQERKRQLAERQAKMFDAQDQVFEEQVSVPGEELAGLSVKHDLQDLADGETILVLADKPILGDKDINDDEDALENINLTELEKTRKNLELKKKKPFYDVYEDELNAGDVDPSSRILRKYNEEEEKKGFKLDASGQVKRDPKQALQSIRDKLNSQQHKKILYELSNSTPAIASEYYTTQELASFKKKKSSKERKKKLRKKTRKSETGEQPSEGIAALLGAEAAPVDESEDHGSRAAHRRRMEMEENEAADKEKKKQSFAKALEKANEQSQVVYGEKPAEEEEEEEFYRMLNKRRRARPQKSIKHIAEAIVKTEPESESTIGTGGDPSLVFTSTSEFVRSLPSEPTFASRTQNVRIKPEPQDKMDEEEHSSTMEEEAQAKEDQEEEEDQKAAFRPVSLSSTSASKSVWKAQEEERNKQEKEEEMASVAASLVEEPMVGSGLAATLRLLEQQGVRSHELETVGGRATDKLLHDEDEDDEEVADKDRKHHKIRLEQVDEFGRRMTRKERFRHLSHKFHGKEPGKKKQEKRLKRYQEELKRRQMANGDTPLSSVEALRRSQQATGQAFVVLSGSARSHFSLSKGNATSAGGMDTSTSSGKKH
ncbi:U4/U6.U5 tri-snRNP-associated protein 1, variant 2 [Balamuthia mandrillaris]